MIQLLMIPVIIFAQTATPTATATFEALFPPLESPTPWASPTPMPTMPNYVDDAADLLATSQADPVDYRADGDQILVDGLPVLPGFNSDDSRQLFGYMRWTTTPAAASVFGPFQAILIPIGLLMTIAFLNLIIFFWEQVLVSIFKTIVWVIERITGIF
jgi:hypothetical protein